ncbi:BatD family protein [Stenotrophomonas sp. CFBP8980]|uniref:BatD family protein n=1 Tax=Stenotrophomonas sp. CFBP8980 TaxID=3096523 RepID=UPI002A69DE8E|nr:BatD family protein [Stenotrophomonas sp. CFBP8980]MDY1032774.1 BatD family protein [Stenotrophomonas sp. CFBP8980]
MTRTASTSAIARLLPWLLAVVLCVPHVASAQTRAWLDRAQVSLGDTVTLNIQSDSAAAPVLTPLGADFELSNQTRSRQVEWINGRMQTRTLHGVALSPRRSGTLVVPPLQVGQVFTEPLQLQVAAAAPARNDGSALAFIETEVDDSSPYVQQSVGVVVRLFYAAQLASGSLVLDTPEGASLQVIGQDRTDVREVNGRRYNVAERRYLLIPERSGPLRVAGARFDGRTAGSFFDDFFGGRGDGRLRAAAADQTLQVQAQPVDAPQPWLPLHDLRLRYTLAPDRARAGEAATLEIEGIAVGATRAQFTDLPVPDVGSDAQVFAEPAQYDETFSGGSPQLKITRRYSIVPRAAGTLEVPGIQMRWWDVKAGQARSSGVPALTLAVAAGSGGAAQPAPPVQALDTDAALPGGEGAAPSSPAGASTGQPLGWMALAAGLLVLWLLTLWWGMRRGRAHRVAPDGHAPTPPDGPLQGTPRIADLRRALDAESFAEVAAVLCAMAGVSRLELVQAKLGDERQRQALQALQKARWAGDGDLPDVRRELKQAFHDGPHWSAPVTSTQTGLPPLYPPPP